MKSFQAFVAVALLGMTTSLLAFGDAVPNQIIIKYKDGVRRNRLVMENIYGTANAEKVTRFHGSTKLRNFEQIILEKGTDVNQVIEQLEKNPAVEYAQPNYILRALPVAKADPTPNPTPTPGNDAPGLDFPCIFPGFPVGCKAEEPSKPVQRPAIAAKPAEVVPPVADPLLDKAYGISTIGAPKAWETTKGSQDIVVAVIDTGIDYNHVDLSFNMWRNPKGEKDGLVGWDFVHNDNLPFDDNEHGTHCAGTIGAVGGNGKGVSGVNQRVSLMAVKFLGADGSGDTAGAIKSIDWAVEHGAKVLSNSWGGPGDEDNKILLDAINRAEAKDVLFVAAAGNESADNEKSPSYPAAFTAPNMLTVAATDENDKLTDFSNWGSKTVQVAAPGNNVYSTVPGDAYASLSGTSMACPHVAGAAALVWSTNPKMTYKEVKARLMDTVDKLPALEGKIVTGGRINVAKAVLGNPSQVRP